VVLSRAVSIFGVLFGLQTLPALFAQFGAMETTIGLTVIVLVFGSLAIGGLAAIFRQWTRSVFALFAGVYLVVLLGWGLVVPGTLPGNDAPWIYYLCNVATSCAALASRRWWIAALYTVLAPVLIIWVRMEPAGGGADALHATLDGVYCFFLGAVLLVIAFALREAAAAVDRAQNLALDSYAAAVRHDATEAERTTVDALVHDSVLTTLLSAARAHSPQAKTLSAQMARNAMRHLVSAQSSFPGAQPDLPLPVLAGRLRLAAAELAAPISVRTEDLGELSVPDAAGTALVLAATQAMVNSVNHAGEGVAREVLVRGLPNDGVEIVVSDEGAGFDPGAIPHERLGVRISILERVNSIGGAARVESTPGAGTRITLGWVPPVVQGATTVLEEQRA